MNRNNTHYTYIRGIQICPAWRHANGTLHDVLDAADGLEFKIRELDVHVVLDHCGEQNDIHFVQYRMHGLGHSSFCRCFILGCHSQLIFSVSKRQMNLIQMPRKQQLPVRYNSRRKLRLNIRRRRALLIERWGREVPLWTLRGLLKSRTCGQGHFLAVRSRSDHSLATRTSFRPLPNVIHFAIVPPKFFQLHGSLATEAA